MKKELWEVYKDGSYLTHFETEAEAKAYCEERGWEVEDPEYGWKEELSYHSVEKIEWARDPAKNTECLIVGNECYKPTGYNVMFSGKWYVELVNRNGEREYISTSMYAHLWEN